MRAVSTILIVLGGLLLAPGLAALYVRVEVIDPDRFEARSIAALQAEPVRRAAAEQLTDELVDAGATELLSVRPLVVSALEAFADTRLFAEGVGVAARDAHGVLVEGREESFVLDVGQTATALLSELASVVPAAAGAVPDDIDPELFALDTGDPRVQAVRAVAAWRAAGFVLPAVAVILLATGVALAARRRAALVLAGGMVAVAGGLLAIALAVGRAITGREAPELAGDVPLGAALTAVYDAYLGDLQAWAVAALVTGAALALTGSEVLDPAQRDSPLRRMAHQLVRPASSAGLRALRGAGLVLVGVLVLLDPLAAVRALAFVAGLGLVVLGLAELADALGRRMHREGPRLGRAPVIALAVGALFAVGASTVAAAVITSRQAQPPADPPVPAAGCNGLRELCGLRLDQVTFAGTHNSMSAAERPGWLFANQRFPIERQLRDGVRLLLIDIHVGVREGGRVRTDLQAEGVSRNRVAKALGPGALAAAERVAGGVGAGDIAGAARAVPVPHAVRAGRRVARPRARRGAALPRRRAGCRAGAVPRAVRAGRPGRGGVRARGPARPRRRAAARRAAADARRAGRLRAPARRLQRVRRRCSAVVHERLLVRAGHAARRHRATRAELRAEPRRCQQPAADGQPLDRPLPAATARERGRRPRVPGAAARTLRARARPPAEPRRRRLLRHERRGGRGRAAQPRGRRRGLVLRGLLALGVALGRVPERRLDVLLGAGDAGLDLDASAQSRR